jgi:nucleoside-diphosphate kinase
MKKTNCTLCVIKPHVIKAQLAGELLTHISSSGYCIEGLFSVHMTLQMAHELFEVYRGMVWLDGHDQLWRHLRDTTTITRLIVFA